MSAQQIRTQLVRKRAQRVDADKRYATERKKEADKRSAATKASAAVRTTKSASTVKTKSRESQRHELAANKAGSAAARWQKKAADYGREEAALQTKLTKAEQSEEAGAERQRKREQQVAERRAAGERAQLEHRITETAERVEVALRKLPAPKPERLRVLLLGASGKGDLRIAREQSRIRKAVQSTLGQDLVDLDVRSSATTDDVFDGINRFRPHVVHFSGHSDHDVLVFEEDVDEHNKGVVVSARAFARALAATDQPPLLILLNSCNSAPQADRLIKEKIAPFAIGMSDEIEDPDAITYAAQFYAGIASGQSIRSAHAQGQVAVEFAGLSGHELPTLIHAADVDPAVTVLVKPAH